MSSRDLALEIPLEGVQLIEASAGTGKTYTLTSLFVRLVIERGLSVRKILVVTFTKAATAELQSRLRERLLLCAQIASGPGKYIHIATFSPEIVQCTQLVEAAQQREGTEQLQRRLRLAVLEIDTAQISTIHGFCQRALSEHGALHGISLDRELVPTDQDLITTIANDLWRAQATSADAQAYAAFAQTVRSANNLARLLPVLLDAQKQVLPLPNMDETRAHKAIVASDHAFATLTQTWRTHGIQAFATLRAHADAGYLNQSTYKTVRIEHERLQLVHSFEMELCPKVELLGRYTSANLQKGIKKGNPALPPQRFFDAVSETLPALQAANIARRSLGLILLHSCVNGAQRRLKAIKHDSGRYSHNDTIRYLHDALHGPQGDRLADTLHTQYPCALVDEFQDTDAYQFAIFQSIYANRGTLFLVGDPKQAIYRFRGGDIYAYLDARNRAAAVHSLNQNFRSSPGYLRAMDNLYTYAGNTAFADPRIHFEPVAAAGKASDTDLIVDDRAITPLTFWNLDSQDETRPNKADALELLAQGCAAGIVDLLLRARAGRVKLRDKFADGRCDYRPLQPRDLAVLVNTHREADAMQTALSAYGVPSVCVSKQSIFATDEAQELHLLLDALASLDESRLRAALATVLFGQTLADFTELAADPERWRMQLVQFSELRCLWETHGVLAMLERIFETRAAALLALERGERRMTNWLQLADLAQLAAINAFDLRGLVDWLAQRIAYADSDNEDEQLRLESDADRVQVLTLHKSKGLEFPVAFLPFAALRRGVKNFYPKLHQYHDAAGKPAIYLAADQDAAEEPAARDAQNNAQNEDLGERLRVLYVGLTRARCACYVAVGIVGKVSKDTNVDKRNEIPALHHLLRLERNADASALHKHLHALAQTAADVIAIAPLPLASIQRWTPESAAMLGPARQMSHKVRSAWRTHSFSQLHSGSGAALREIAGNDDERSSSNEALTSATTRIPAALHGVRFGTAFHEVLEFADFAAWRDCTADMSSPTQHALIERVMQRHALANDHDHATACRLTASLVATTLNTPLPAGLRLAELAPKCRRAELPFHFAIAGIDTQRLLSLMHEYGYLRNRARFALDSGRIAGLMNGVLDLVFIHNNRWWVIDYKTNLLGAEVSDYAPARLATAVRDSEYDLQYLIYLTALHRWLKTRLGSDYGYARDVGGALYLFVRGLNGDGINGIHHDRPPVALIEALDTLLAAPRKVAA